MILKKLVVFPPEIFILVERPSLGPLPVDLSRKLGNFIKFSSNFGVEGGRRRRSCLKFRGCGPQLATTWPQYWYLASGLTLPKN